MLSYMRTTPWLVLPSVWWLRESEWRRRALRFWACEFIVLFWYARASRGSLLIIFLAVLSSPATNNSILIAIVTSYEFHFLLKPSMSLMGVA